MVTGATYLKRHVLTNPSRLSFFNDMLFELARRHEWMLQAWAIFSNHYHFVAYSPEDPRTLRPFISTLHTLSAREFNRLDGTPGRRVCYQYYDSKITYQRSYMARLRYVHENPVHHGLVRDAARYPWCSAAWFERHASRAMQRTIQSFRVDRIGVFDAFAALRPRDNEGL